MTQKIARPRGRPITNKIEQIPASPEKITKAMFRVADKKATKAKPVKKKPN